MRLLRDFACGNAHVHEALVESDEECRLCPVCGEPALKRLSAPRARLEPFTGAFPGAYDAWERKRNERMAVERKKERDHGPNWYL